MTRLPERSDKRSDEDAVTQNTSPAPCRPCAAALAAVLSVALAACAVTPAPVWAEERSAEPYGDYLAARWAGAQRSPEDAAHFYRQALEKAPGDTMLTAQAFNTSLLAGDYDIAARLGAEVLEADSENSRARLTLAVDAMARRDWRAASALLDGAAFGALDAITASILEAWAQAGAGDPAGAAVSLDDSADTLLFSALIGLHKALLLDRARDPAAEPALRASLETFALPSFAVREYGRYLERQGWRDLAQQVYRDRLAADPEDRVVEQELARLERRRRAPAMAPTQAAALALYSAAAALIGRDFSDRSEAYLVMALRLDDEFAQARILLGQIVASQGRYDRAAEMFQAAAVDPALGGEAGIRLAQLASLRGDEAESRALLRALWEETGGEAAARALADALRAGEQWEEGEALLTELIDARAARGDSPDWRLHYSRAVMRERQDNWAPAETDFRAAIAINPGDPGLLNYLGYVMVDRGMDIEEGFALIQRAVELAPRDGYIIDSLGWAYYRLGDYQEAVTHLERAASLQPGEADINDHLGDAYWRVGRELEARFQWRRALTLDPEPELRAGIETKLDSGLPPADDSPAMAEQR